MRSSADVFTRKDVAPFLHDVTNPMRPDKETPDNIDFPVCRVSGCLVVKDSSRQFTNANSKYSVLSKDMKRNFFYVDFPIMTMLFFLSRNYYKS